MPKVPGETAKQQAQRYLGEFEALSRAIADIDMRIGLIDNEEELKRQLLEARDLASDAERVYSAKRQELVRSSSTEGIDDHTEVVALKRRMDLFNVEFEAVKARVMGDDGVYKTPLNKARKDLKDNPKDKGKKTTLEDLEKKLKGFRSDKKELIAKWNRHAEFVKAQGREDEVPPPPYGMATASGTPSVTSPAAAAAAAPAASQPQAPTRSHDALPSSASRRDTASITQPVKQPAPTKKLSQQEKFEAEQAAIRLAAQRERRARLEELTQRREVRTVPTDDPFAVTGPDPFAYVSQGRDEASRFSSTTRGSVASDSPAPLHDRGGEPLGTRRAAPLDYSQRREDEHSDPRYSGYRPTGDHQADHADRDFDTRARARLQPESGGAARSGLPAGEPFGAHSSSSRSPAPRPAPYHHQGGHYQAESYQGQHPDARHEQGFGSRRALSPHAASSFEQGQSPVGRRGVQLVDEYAAVPPPPNRYGRNPSSVGAPSSASAASHEVPSSSRLQRTSPEQGGALGGAAAAAAAAAATTSSLPASSVSGVAPPPPPPPPTRSSSSVPSSSSLAAPSFGQGQGGSSWPVSPDLPTVFDPSSVTGSSWPSHQPEGSALSQPSLPQRAARLGYAAQQPPFSASTSTSTRELVHQDRLSNQPEPRVSLESSSRLRSQGVGSLRGGEQPLHPDPTALPQHSVSSHGRAPSTVTTSLPSTAHHAVSPLREVDDHSLTLRGAWEPAAPSLGRSQGFFYPLGSSPDGTSYAYEEGDYSEQPIALTGSGAGASLRGFAGGVRGSYLEDEGGSQSPSFGSGRPPSQLQHASADMHREAHFDTGLRIVWYPEHNSASIGIERDSYMDRTSFSFGEEKTQINFNGMQITHVNNEAITAENCKRLSGVLSRVPRNGQVEFDVPNPTAQGRLLKTTIKGQELQAAQGQDYSVA